jgi:hypothetical protein
MDMGAGVGVACKWQALNVIIDTGSANFALAAKPFPQLHGQA